MEEINHPIFKFIIEKALVPLITALLALTVQRLASRNKKINNSASMDDLKKIEEGCINYTDQEIKKHITYSHANIIEDIRELKDSNKEVNGKLDKILFMMVGKNK